MQNRIELLDKENLGDLLDSFSKATGIYIDAVDMQGKSLINNRKCEKSEFCKYIRESEDGKLRCQKSYEIACNECGKWNEAYFFKCHTGLVMWAIPIIIEEQQVGAIVCGQVLLWKPDKFFFKELETFNKNICDFEELKEKVVNLNIISADKCKSVVTMLAVFVNYLLNRYNKIFIEENEVLEWRTCMLQKIQERKKEYKDYKFDNSVYLKREKRLLQYIRTANKESVKKILPTIFSDIEILSEFEYDKVQDLCVELMTLISRAAVDGGIESDVALSIARKFKADIKTFKNSEEVFNHLNTNILTLLDMIYILGNSSQNNILKSAKDYIDKNYNRKITIDEIAESIYISKYYLAHLFKDNLNMTINDYITRVRIEKAVELMQRRELSNNDIMQEVGFNSQSHFTKTFKKIMGVTPGNYRKKFM